MSPGYIGSYACDGLAMALHCVYHTKNLKECILKTINLRGDADSVGSVAAQLAGALYGIECLPKSLREMVLEWDNEGEIALRAKYLIEKNYKKQ
mmetsp:Transcript_40948/g.36310  ORF Transcript_40948/g.36310 Transcript_40948/m.36310 type:complete len:94 (-) Transcript_40948:236-517(-)